MTCTNQRITHTSREMIHTGKERKKKIMHRNFYLFYDVFSDPVVEKIDIFAGARKPPNLR
jgi:hypothetical protein